jgi:hypothetical protein
MENSILLLIYFCFIPEKLNLIFLKWVKMQKNKKQKKQKTKKDKNMLAFAKQRAGREKI